MLAAALHKETKAVFSPMEYKMQNANYFEIMKCKIPKFSWVCLVPFKIPNFLWGG
jgi:hypothetical protein